MTSLPETNVTPLHRGCEGSSDVPEHQDGGKPSDIATFLFTDVEGSTRLLERHPAAYREALAMHHSLLRGAVEQHRGRVFETVGDAVYAIFELATDAAAAAVSGQSALQGAEWGEIGALNVRMGLHTGEVERQGDHYFGVPLYRCARLMSTAHGGQVVVSAATAALIRDMLASGLELRDLGEHRLRDLQHPERIFQLTAAGLRTDFPPLRTVQERCHNLPSQLTTFIGRQKEAAHACDLLSQPHARLLTLTGPGGVGKTRLALQVAGQSLHRYSGGVFFVELAPVLDANLVMPAVAAALGLHQTAKRPISEILQDYLRDREMLLVVDNFEHVLTAAPQLAVLLAACPLLKILVTSREVLHVSGEQRLAVPPLEMPGPTGAATMADITRCDAIQLFAERARAVQPEFKMSTADVPAVLEICRRVDGLPLAIELAAARINMFSPAAILSRMSKPLAVLTGGPCDSPLRQKTMRQTFAWSYNLLSAEEQRLLRRVAVFVGSAPLTGIEAVTSVTDGKDSADVLGGLSSLIDKSLLRRDEACSGDEPRFTMLETIREYALERLAEAGESAALFRRHADYYLSLAMQAEPDLIGRRAAVWLERLQKEYDNIRAALSWLVEQNAVVDGLSLAAALARFWRAHGYITEARQRLAALLSLPQASRSQSAHAKALHVAGWLAREQGDYAEARGLLEKSLKLYRELGEPRGTGWALFDLAFVTRYEADYPRARGLLDEYLTLQRKVRDPGGVARALGSLGFIARDEGDTATAEAYLQESLALWQELSDPIGMGWTLTALGIVARSDDRCDAARTRLEKALALWREIGDRQNIANVLGTLAVLARDRGEFARAAALLRESLTLLQEIGDRRAIAFVLEGFAGLAAAQGHAARALEIAAAALSARERIGAPAPPGWRAELEQILAAASSGLAAEFAADATNRGASMSLAEAIALALEAGAP